MLALENKATVIKDESEPQVVEVQAQPFGGAVRILDLGRLSKIAGGYNFDTDSSRTEKDFRIFIQPKSWTAVLELCLKAMRANNHALMELDPHRELKEEFWDALKIRLRENQYRVKFIKLLVEENSNFQLPGSDQPVPTKRIYLVYSADLIDAELWKKMIQNWQGQDPTMLTEQAIADHASGGKGRANGLFVTSYEKITQAYLAIPEAKRRERVEFEGDNFMGNVSAILDDVDVAKRYSVVVSPDDVRG